MLRKRTEFQVVSERLGGFGEKRDHPTPIPFPVADPDQALIQIDVVELKIQELLATEPGADKEREDGTIPDAAHDESRLLCGSYQLLHLLRGQEHGGSPWGCGKENPPERITRDIMPVRQVVPERSQGVESSSRSRRTETSASQPDEVISQQVRGDRVHLSGGIPLFQEMQERLDVVPIGPSRVRAEAPFHRQIGQEFFRQRLQHKHGNVPPRGGLLGLEDAFPSRHAAGLMLRFQRDFGENAPRTGQYKQWSGPVSRVLSWASIYLGLRLPTASCGQPGAHAASG